MPHWEASQDFGMRQKPTKSYNCWRLGYPPDEGIASTLRTSLNDQRIKVWTDKRLLFKGAWYGQKGDENLPQWKGDHPVRLAWRFWHPHEISYKLKPHSLYQVHFNQSLYKWRSWTFANFPDTQLYKRKNMITKSIYHFPSRISIIVGAKKTGRYTTQLICPINCILAATKIWTVHSYRDLHFMTLLQTS